MKSNYPTKKLGEICEVISGQSPEGKFYNKKRDGLPFYQGKKEFTDKFIGSPNVWTIKITKEAQENDILMSVRAPVGPINFATQKICIGRGLAAIRVGKNIDKDFLFYFLFSNQEKISGNAGAVFASISKKDIENYQIPLPPLFDQHRIVKILDEVFEDIKKAKENAEKNIQNSKNIFESYLQSFFAKPSKEWEIKKLGECFKLKSGDNITSKVMIKNGKFPVYGGNGIAGMYNKSNLSGNNIIIGRVGALCGKVRHIKEDIWLTDNGFKIVNFKYDFDNGFLTYLLNFKNLRSFARQAAQPVISNSSLENVLLEFPKSKEEQKAIVKKLDELAEQTKKLEKNYKQKLLLLDELKKSVLQKAFSGELS